MRSKKKEHEAELAIALEQIRAMESKFFYNQVDNENYHAHDIIPNLEEISNFNERANVFRSMMYDPMRQIEQ